MRSILHAVAVAAWLVTSGVSVSAQTSDAGTAGTAAAPPSRPAPKTTGTLTLDNPGRADASPGPPNAGALAGRPRASTSRTTAAPSIDGRLDDPAWRTATHITDFVQERPLEGVPATEQTEVYITYDSQRLYLGVYAHYSDASLIRANRVDRDRANNDDYVSFYFDPFLDQQRAYVFSVNAYGVQGDAIMNGGPGGGQAGSSAASGIFQGATNRGGGSGGGSQSGTNRGGSGGQSGGAGGQDSSWDALFSSAGRLVAGGWTAELAIPFKSLRYPARRPGEPHLWGFQIQREIQGKNESVVWAPTSRDVMGFLTQMGLLEGLSGLSTSRNLEVLPTVTDIQAGSLDRTSGRYGALSTKPEAGVNVKYGITSNLTADFTFNPDFSQIESDQQQIDVNQRFPLFFAELRPFFLEGQEIFQVAGPVTFVHTRTIVDPDYGVKVTGKVGKTTLGVLVANDAAPGHVDDPADPAFGRSAQFLIGRLRYDVYSESSVGVLVTDREFMDSFSRVGGLTGQFKIGRNHQFNFTTMFSDSRDAAGLRQSGPLIDLGFRKEGRNLSYSLVHYEIDPGFRTDTGFVRRVDMRQTQANVQYRWWPQSWIVNWGPRLQVARNYDFAGVLQDEEITTAAQVQFSRNVFVTTGVSRDMERFGGIPFRKTRAYAGGSVNASRRFGVGGYYSAGDQVRYLDDPYLGRGGNSQVFANLRPFSRLQSQINVTTSRLVDPLTEAEVFNVKLYRAQTSYQFTSRLVARNILEYNDLAKTLGVNLLLTYRVNSGTAFYVGYDDRYQQGTAISSALFPTPAYERTNRALFAKLQYLFRY